MPTQAPVGAGTGGTVFFGTGTGTQSGPGTGTGNLPIGRLTNLTNLNIDTTFYTNTEAR